MDRPFDMSSTSSRDDFHQYWPCDTGYMNYRNAYGSRYPFYPTMGQPMVYCTQAVCPCDPPPLPRTIKNRGRDQQRSPNCFVKAFRWYTQEHVPSTYKSSSPPKHDMSGFAAWLDVKYDQFLEENQMGSDMYHVKVRQTFEAERGPTPWKKKRRAKSNEGGITQQRSNHSCHYIMKPKENMSRPPSVCCRPSYATTAGSECGKSVCKSHSLSNMTLIIKSKEQDDVTPAQGDIGDKSRGDICQPNTCQPASYKPKTNLSPNKTYSGTSLTKKVEVSTTNKTISSQDFCCQCGQEKAISVDAETQYDMEPPNIRLGSIKSNKSERPDDCTCQTLDKNLHRSTSRDSHNVSRPLEAIPPCERGTASCECMPVKKVTQKPVTVKESQRTVPRVYNNMECQCPEEKVVTVDAQTQYMSRPASTNNNICECNLKGFVRRDETPVQGVPIPSNKLCPCERKVKDELVADKLCVKFAQTISQTSNHSICLEKKSVHEYPLFLKIVCADKLS